MRHSFLTTPKGITVTATQIPADASSGQLQWDAAITLGDAVILQLGTSRTVDLKIVRNGFQGALEPQVTNAPGKLAVKLTPVPADGDTGKLEIVAAADAADAKQDMRVEVKLFGRVVQVPVPLPIAKRPYHVDAYRVLTLAPGNKKRIELPVQRSGYDGQFQVARRICRRAFRSRWSRYFREEAKN
jgi:hypothetical protein